MKKVLSLVLALVLVLGSFPAFAAEMTAGEKLKDAGFIAGGEGGDLMADKPLKRGELASLLAELNGVKEEAKNYEGTSDLTDIADHWSKNYVNYAVKQGWITGYPDKTYKPEEVVTGQQLQNVLLKVLGYVVEWDTVPATANTLELTVPAGEMLRADAFKTVWTAVNTNVKGTEEKLGVKLGKLVETPVVTELNVADVKSTNLREIMVKFNVAVDKTTATEKANYTLSKGTVEKVVLSEDKMMATLTVSGLGNQDSVKVEAKKIKDEAKALTIVANENTITMFDATIPTADGIKLVGPKTFEITFSEPIKTVGTVKINNGVYGVAKVTSGLTNVVTVELAASSLAEGDYTVNISDGFKDFAGYPAMAKTFTLTYAKETTAPTVTLEKASQTTVVVKFDEKVKMGSDAKKYFYHTFSGYTPKMVTPSADGKSYTLTFATGDKATDKPLQEGTVNVVVRYTDGTTAISDEWGNKMTADVTLTAEIEADKTAPTVAKVEPVKNDQNKIAVYFSEDVTVAASNFVVKDADGKAVEVTVNTPEVQTDKTYKVELTSSKALSGVYTVEIKNVKDKALAPNTIVAVTESVDVTDVTAPTLTDATMDVKVIPGSGDTKTVIYVYYPEKMAVSGVNSVLDKANYQLATTTANTAYAKLADKAKVEMFKDGKVVKITLEDTQAVAGRNLRIGRVADLKGNVVSAFVSDLTTENATSTVTVSAKQIDYRTVEFTVNSLLQGTATNAFYTSTDGTTTLSVASITNITEKSGKTIITALVNNGHQFGTTATATQLAKVGINGSVLKSDIGKSIDAASTTTVTDAWGPIQFAKTVTTHTTGNATFATGSVNVITLVFSENLAGTASFFGNDLVITDKDGKALVNGVDYNTTAATNVLTITFAKSFTDKVTVKSAETINHIKDAAGNKAATFKAIEFKLK